MSLPPEAVYGATGLVTYFAGAIPFGWLAARFAKGVDLRTVGSGNIGATNAARVLGLAWFPPIFALDFLKGFAPVFWLAPWVAQRWPCPVCPSLESSLGALCGLTAVAGHLFPIYLGFRGGKGVATAGGVVFAISPIAGAVAAAVWLAVFAVTRYVSLGSVVAAVALPVAHYFSAPASGWKGADNWIRFGLLAAMSVAVILRHRENLGRLRRGEEPKIGAGKA